MKVLVTGATGIVGSNLVRALLEAAHEVRVLLRPASDARGIAGLALERCMGDVLDPPSLAKAAAGCGIVFHAAAQFSYSAPPADQERLATQGTHNVLVAARDAGARRVVVTSSSVTVGSSERPEVLDEDAVFDEPDAAPYIVSKVRQEKVAFETAAALGLDVVAVCPALVVGAHDHRLSPSNASIVNYLNDPFRATFLGGCNIVSARDVAAAHLVAAERGRAGSRYLAGSENLTWREVHAAISQLAGTFGPSLVLNHTAAYLAAAAVEVAARLAGTRPAVTRDEARMAGRYYWYRHERLAQLGWDPAPARRALAVALAWLHEGPYLSHGVAEKLRLAPEALAARESFHREAPA